MEAQGLPRVGLKDLKTLILSGRDRDDPVFRLILSQPDSLPVDVFLARVDDWLRLSEMGDRRHPRSLGRDATEPWVAEEAPS